VDAGQALEHELVDPVAVPRDRSGDAGEERRPLGRKSSDDLERLLAQLLLEGEELRLARDRRERRPPRVVQFPGPVELVAEERGDPRPGLGRGTEDGQHLQRGTVAALDGRGGPDEEDCAQRGKRETPPLCDLAAPLRPLR
jgi:hypothetical protein